MPFRAEILGEEVTLTEEKWSTPIKELSSLLNNHKDFISEDYGPANGAYLHYIFNETIRSFGGASLEEEEPFEGKEGVVY